MTRMELARRNRKLSQDQLGHVARVTQAFVSLIELKRGVPTPEQASRLARALGLDSRNLLDDIQEDVEAVSR